MQTATEAKQRYLRQNILQSNYDPQQFVNFLKDDLLIDELDVEVLTMKTIQEIVLKFKQYKYYTETRVTDQPNKKIKIDYEKNGTVYDYEFSQICRCVNAESFTKELEIFIPNFEIKQTEGIFFSIGSRTEIWYIITTNLNKQPIKRQQQDFEWLSNTIMRLFPLQAIPELIPVAKEHEGNYAKRRGELEQYLQILGSRSQLRLSNIYYQFLTAPAEKMEKIKKNGDSLGFAKGIQSIKNESGEVKVSITNKLRGYVQNTSTYNRRIQTLHQTISNSIQKVMQIMNTAAIQFNKIVDSFAQIHECYNQLINKFPEQKISDYNDILINVNNLFHLLSQNMVLTSKIMQTNLKEYYKISINYDKSINKLYRNVFQTEKDYVSSKINLNRKKERFYPDVSRWQVDQKLLQNRRLSKEEAFQIMLPRQTIQQVEQKLWLGYLYNNYDAQFNRYINYEVKRYVNVFCTFTSQILLNNRNYVQQLTKFIEESKKIGND